MKSEIRAARVEARRLISEGESDTVEFKRAFAKDVVETVCAFANHRGGTVLVGVADDGSIVGTSCGSESLQKWANEIKQNTSPSIVPDVGTVGLGGKSVVWVRVAEFPIKPVSFRDRYFKRVAGSNHRLSPTEIANLHLQSLQLSWDSYVDSHATIKDLSAGRAKAVLKRINESGRVRVEGEWRSVLEKLGYVKDGGPTHAAMLLFGKDQPPHSVHIGRFKTPSTIIDDRMVRGTLFDVVDEAMRIVISHIKVAFEITGQIERREIFEYPVPALRELLLNAVVHRDYTSPADIQIKIFDTSIVFFNPGRLYGDLTVADLQKDNYQSRIRNKLIAEAFYLTRDIEKYGTGFIRIRNEISQYPTMTLTCEESGDAFLAALAYTRQKTASRSKASEGVTEGVTEGVREGLNLLMAQMRDTPGKRIPQLSKDLGLASKTTERWIAKLRREGKVEFRGSSKTGGYYVTTPQA